MKNVIAISVLCAALGACATGGAGSPQYGEVANSAPPIRYRQPITALVTFSDDVRRDCIAAGLKVEPRQEVEACTMIGGERPHMILSMPFVSPSEFGRHAGHEIGHANGWSKNHGH